MAENPTNRRAVKFWTSDFGTAVQVATADGWMVVDVGSLGRGRRARVVSCLAGRAGASDWPAVSPSMPPLVSVGLPGLAEDIA